MKKIKVLLLSMLLSGVILTNATSLTVNAQTNSQTTAEVQILDGGFSFITSENNSFYFPVVDFTLGKENLGYCWIRQRHLQ